MIKKLPWHTIFLLMYAVLFLYAENISMVKAADMLKPLMIFLPAAGGIWLVCRLLLKDAYKAGILASVVIFLFFNYGQYYNLLYPERIPIIKVRFDHNFYKWFSLLLILLVFRSLRKSAGSPVKLATLLNIISMALLAMPLVKIINYKAQSTSTVIGHESISVRPVNDKSIGPNIFYIVVDAYGRADVLKELYGHNNKPFLRELEKRGFYVADQSISNYGQTVLSLPSTFNMTYLDSFARVVGTNSKNRWPLKQFLNNSVVLGSLKEMGYTSTSFDAAMFEAVYLDSADNFIITEDKPINLFWNELLNSTIIRAFQNSGKRKKLKEFDLHRRKILNAFDLMKDLANEDGKHFVHGHVLAPHQPFVFDSLGNPIDPGHYYTIWRPIEERRDPEKYKKQYISQLKFINTKLLELVDEIQSLAGDNTVIIIQGDHGPGSELRNTKGYDNNNFKERLSILNAYYFPDKDYAMLYEEISPVNTYRVLFNKYFGTQYRLLEDRSYFSTWNLPYRFYDVTSEVR